MEKYISFSLGALRFIDSLQFMNLSLEKLVDNLDVKSFKHVMSEMKELELVTKKGVYPYDYTSDFSKFEEVELPPKMTFYSILNAEDISDDDYLHAQNVWKTFNMKNIGEYHDLPQI